MQYALLFYNPPLESNPAPERQQEIAKMLREMAAWRAELERAGAFRTGLRLASVDAATSLRRKGDDLLVTDGPFAETKEVLGGLFLIECADLDQALDFARRCPLARIGTVELRPEFGAPR